MKTLITIFTVAALPLWLGGCGQRGHEHSHDDGHGSHTENKAPSEVTLSETAFQQHGLRVETVQQHTLEPVFAVPARVAFNEEATAHVGTLVRGRVSAMWVHLGQTVTNGAPLFDIESPELGAVQNAFLQALDANATARATVALAQNSAGVMQAQGKLDAAKPGLQRATELLQSGQKLFDEGALANTELKRREASKQTAAAEVRSVAAALARAKAQQAKEVNEAKNAAKTAQATVAIERNRLTLFGMDRDALARLAETRLLDPIYKVRAPCAGTVVEREVTQGENVSPDQSHLLILADLTHVWVLMAMPPSQAGSVKRGMPVTLLNKDTGDMTTAKLDYISPTVDTETRTVQARVELANADGRWRPGQFLTAQLPTGGKGHKTLAVPAEAVQMVNGQPTVYVQPDVTKFTFKSRPVAAGESVAGWRPVTGLDLGERVVVKGTFVLKAEFGKAGAGHDHSH